MSNTTDMQTALATMPKAELHLHIEGTLEPELAFEFARRNGVRLPWRTLDELRAQYRFANLQSFLDLYYALMRTLRTADDFRDLMLAYLERAARDGVMHAEIFFDPQVHVFTDHVDYDTVLDGLREGLRLGAERYGVTGALILSLVRDMDVATADRILDMAQTRSDEVIGVGLDSAEAGHPPSMFVDQFARARSLGWHAVAHAGEEGPADYIRQALDLLHAERIDHGIHILDDDELEARVIRDRIPLTCCPLSNLRLQVVGSIDDHPLPRMVHDGLVCTVNSDDPAYFGGYVAANYAALASTGMPLDMLAALAANSIEASFADDADKERMRGRLARWRDEHGL
ncbi:adenosine deaminase [Bifidobacterium castoris]|uniref:Adenine deaminase n=1 Tax=Bifidobacterium castoris TaxID=2306972 RepID=A0A430FA17_9BIFI|nr:adenosine deaminase [Bifidobacterium castoris]RSX49674.1 adenosine deaminase [Bifidobacterium castoris]